MGSPVLQKWQGRLQSPFQSDTFVDATSDVFPALADRDNVETVRGNATPDVRLSSSLAESGCGVALNLRIKLRLDEWIYQKQDSAKPIVASKIRSRIKDT